MYACKIKFKLVILKKAIDNLIKMILFVNPDLAKLTNWCVNFAFTY